MSEPFQSFFRVVPNEERKRDDSIDRLPQLKAGDHVRLREGLFLGYVGEVRFIDVKWGTVTIQIEAFGRSVPVECGRSQLEFAAEG